MAGNRGVHWQREAAVQAFAADVQHAVGRQRGTAGAFLQTGAGVAAAMGVLQRLQRWRGAAEHHRHAQRGGAFHGHVPGGIRQAILLLVGAVVFLVDDDQAEPGEGREHGRAGADEDAMLAAGAFVPNVEALRVRDAGVQHRGSAEAGPHAVQRLRCERDLRHQQQRLAATAQHLGNDVEIHLRLAAAGDAIEQVAAVLAEAGDDALDGGALGGCWLNVRFCQRRGFGVAAEREGVVPGDQPLLAQCGQDAAGDAGRGQFVIGDAAGLGKLRERLALAWRPGQCRPSLGLGAPHRLWLRLRLGAAPSGGRQHRRQHVADGMVVVRGQPLRQRHQIRRQQRFGVQHLVDWFEIVAARFGVADHHAQRP